MRGGCRSFALVNIFLVSLLVACGDDRRTGAAPPDSNQGEAPPVGAMSDTVSHSAADTGTSSAVVGDSAPPPPDLARATPPKKAPAPAKPAAPAPKPAPPAPKPAAPPPPAADSPPAAAPAQTTDTATAGTQATTPLRDAYHQAPRDTLSQEGYDGWKQYNLLCARCHGEDVMGTTIAPHLVVSLKPDGPINTKELFVQTVCAGRPEKGMPAWCPLGLEMDKIEAIYVYVKGRSEGKIHPGRPAVKAEG